MTNLLRYLETASLLAQNAARVVMELHQKPIILSRKVDQSIVTEADLASDRLIREGLSKAFPDHAIVTEEEGLSGRTGSDWVWMVDPLDGTKAYARGIPGFSVMIGLLKEGKPCLGVVVDPIENRIYEASRERGAWLTAQGTRSPLRVSGRSDFKSMPLAISTGFPEERLKTIQEKLGCPARPPINSVGIKVGLVVRQEADIYLSHHPVHYWDTCAPQAILEEAGGRFTFLDGRALTYDLNGSLQHEGLPLATNGTRHEDLLSLLSLA